MADQPLPTEGRESVTDVLIDFLRQRQARGIETYGRSLETWNGRDAVQDALEEAVDLAQYLLQWRLERAALLHDRRIADLACELVRHHEHTNASNPESWACWHALQQAARERKV